MLYKEDEPVGHYTKIGTLKYLLKSEKKIKEDKNSLSFVADNGNEVRLVNGNVKYIGDVEGFRFPHVYVELEKNLEVKEVILGPKIANPIEIANYLYYTDNVHSVSKSRIKYQ